jgi:hypothetical protein
MTDPAAKDTASIFRTEALVVSAPFVDDASVARRELAVHSSLDAALAWIAAKDLSKELHLEVGTQKLLFLRVTERALDVGPLDYRGHVTLSAAGDIVERCGQDGGEPALGRDGRHMLGHAGDAGARDLPSKRRSRFPTCCLQSDAGFLFTSLDSASTGVDGAIWCSAGEFMRPPSPRGPRILIVPGEWSARQGLERAIEVRLANRAEVLGTLPPKVARQVVRFVEKNRELLLSHWKLENSSGVLFELLERV